MNVDFRNYKILGACNPPFAYESLKAERMVGTMLPCNVIVQETKDGQTEVAAVDPVASMQAIENPNLKPIAEKIQAKLKKVIDSISGGLHSTNVKIVKAAEVAILRHLSCSLPP